jgi:hypothetical protein
MNVLIGKYFSYADLKESGPIEATITKVVAEQFGRKGQETEEKFVIYFKEVPQGLSFRPRGDVAKEFAEVLGSANTEKWVGQRVVIFGDPNVTMEKKKVGGARLKKP